jgi:steroid 5-alpha reductase family enzyme
MFFELNTILFSIGLCLVAVILLALTGWFYSLWADEVSIVAPLWPIMVLVCALIFDKFSGAQGVLSLALVVMVSLWALRMALFLLIRDYYRPEQRQYRLMRIELSSSFYRKSLPKIFFGHAITAWIASFIFAIVLFDIARGDVEWSWVHNLAIGLFSLGFIIQAVADYQLHSYSRNLERVGGTFEKGLWRYSRHPNYFAECIIWWSWGIFALPSGNILAIISPIFITYLMVTFKAGQEVEDEISSRRPDYKNYIRSTSFIVPWRSKL